MYNRLLLHINVSSLHQKSGRNETVSIKFIRDLYQTDTFYIKILILVHLALKVWCLHLKSGQNGTLDAKLAKLTGRDASCSYHHYTGFEITQNRLLVRTSFHTLWNDAQASLIDLLIAIPSGH